LEDRMETATSATQVYQLFIKATPEQVWDAITKPELVAQYFHGARQESTYEVGTPIKSWSPDRSKLWGDNIVLESDPPKRLSHSWRSLYDEEMAAEEESRVTWEIEPQEGGYCKLTLVHDRLEGAPKTAANVRGWQLILDGLKTLVETGKPLVESWG
ncbi:MAG TPA: SRPBCC family protein, partial [Candidatus Eisenbacteria bacterium]|nr:SRPBCC family protein [Candidatus Eisenbacteria bacterium]